MVTWRRLYNEELHKLYLSPNIVRVDKLSRVWAGYVARMGGIRNAYSILVGKPRLGKIVPVLN
jgi:hypothetical protein